jgi:hypothetical protein
MQLNRPSVRLNSAVAILTSLIYLCGVAMADPTSKNRKHDDFNIAPDSDSFSESGSDTFSESPTPTFEPPLPRLKKPDRKTKRVDGDGLQIQNGPTVNLRIHHGRWWDSTMNNGAGGYRGGAEVLDNEEESVGAFGCTNWNDTNGNGVMDIQDKIADRFRQRCQLPLKQEQHPCL